MRVLVLNSGSSTLKHQVVDPATGERLRHGLVERLGEERTHAHAIHEVLETLGDLAIDAVGHRVVHGGEAFVDPSGRRIIARAKVRGLVRAAGRKAERRAR